MNYCENCELKNTVFPIMPNGSVSPTYYIVGSMANSNDILCESTAYNDSGEETTYLYNILDSVGIREESRLFKVVRCDSPNSYDEESVVNICKNYLFGDIIRTNPKVIITLGAIPTKALLGDQFDTISKVRGSLHDITIGDNTYKVIPTFSPKYALQSSNSISYSKLYNDVVLARSYVEGKLVDISTKYLTYATTYQEFYEYYEKYLINSEVESFDLETNAYDPRSTSARIVGYSLSPGGNTGIYILRESLEMSMSPEDYDKCVELTVQLLSSKKVLVHNCMYEIPFTYNEWGYYIKDFDDTLIKCRLMLGGKLGASLKDRCVEDLGYPNWDKDLGIYRDAFNALWSGLSPTATSTRWDYLEIMSGTKLEDLLQKYNRAESLNSRESKNRDSLTELINVISKYYSVIESRTITELVAKKLVALISSSFNGPFSYGFIPSRIITKYGALDAVATHDLNDSIDARLKSLSEDMNVDMVKGYNYMKQHYICGVWMEMNGMYWNDEVANQELSWYEDQCLTSTKGMLLSPLLLPTIIDNNIYRLNDYIKENDLDLLLEKYGDISIMKSCIRLNEKFDENGKKVKISYKSLIDEMTPEYIKSHKYIVTSEVMDEVLNATHYTDVKYLFNPASSTDYQKELLSNIWITPDIKVANLMNKLSVKIENPGFEFDRYTDSEKALLQVLITSSEYNKTVSSISDTEDNEELEELKYKLDSYELDEFEIEEEDIGKVKLSNSRVFESFKQVLSETSISSRDLVKLVRESDAYKIESLSDPVIIELHDYYVLTGTNDSDPSTWDDRYQFLMYFRIWKKCNKMISTYIHGKKVGRGSVYVVDKNSLQNGDILSKRLRLYDGTHNDNEDYVMQSKFAVCTANSFRWRSGQHTIPAGSSIKNIYTSRFENGTIAMPDYSQMELRALSGAANCTAMKQAFIDGADIHRRNAANIFQKPEEEITSAERRYSKMAGFMIVYGGDYRSFGEEFLDGDIGLAKDIYDKFFKAYPEIKQYSEDKHKEMHSKGMISVPNVGLVLKISPEDYNGDIGKAERVAGNAGIQGSSSMMAGCTIYEIKKFIDENNLKSKVILFVHDSIEVDIHPDELLMISSKIIPLMNDYPLDEFGIPAKADLALGASIGQEITVTNLECNDTYTEGTMEMECYEDEFLPLMERWQRAYKSVTWEDIEEPKVVNESWSGIWLAHKAMSKFYGKDRLKIHRLVKVVIK